MAFKSGSWNIYFRVLHEQEIQRANLVEHQQKQTLLKHFTRCKIIIAEINCCITFYIFIYFLEVWKVEALYCLHFDCNVVYCEDVEMFLCVFWRACNVFENKFFLPKNSFFLFYFSINFLWKLFYFSVFFFQQMILYFQTLWCGIHLALYFNEFLRVVPCLNWFHNFHSISCSMFSFRIFIIIVFVENVMFEKCRIFNIFEITLNMKCKVNWTGNDNYVNLSI